MASISDVIQTPDKVVAMLDKSMALAYPCPQCGKAGKEDHAPGMMVCSNRNCRFKYEKASVKPVEVRDGSKPAFPCPACGKESKEDHAPETRICSSVNCRHKFSS